MFFNYGQFTISALQGFLTSMVLFMIPMGKFFPSYISHPTTLAIMRYANTSSNLIR